MCTCLRVSAPRPGDRGGAGCQRERGHLVGKVWVLLGLGGVPVVELLEVDGPAVVRVQVLEDGVQLVRRHL